MCRTNRNAWKTEPHRLTGRGIGVAVLDTGCFLHEDLQNRIAAFRDGNGFPMMTTDMALMYAELSAEMDMPPPAPAAVLRRNAI